MTWLLVASLYIWYSPSEIQTMRFETEEACVQYGNLLVANEPRFRYFCVNLKDNK